MENSHDNKQKRINLSLNEKNEKDAKIIAYLDKKYDYPGTIKEILYQISLGKFIIVDDDNMMNYIANPAFSLVGSNPNNMQSINVPNNEVYSVESIAEVEDKDKDKDKDKDDTVVPTYGDKDFDEINCDEIDLF